MTETQEGLKEIILAHRLQGYSITYAGNYIKVRKGATEIKYPCNWQDVTTIKKWVNKQYQAYKTGYMTAPTEEITTEQTIAPQTTITETALLKKSNTSYLLLIAAGAYLLMRGKK